MSGEVDPEALRSELRTIKEAMGVSERYPSQFRLWLVYGGLVLGASLVSQFVALRGLPGYWHAVAWFGFMGAGGLYGWYTGSSREGAETGTKPNIPLQFGAVFALYFVFLFALAPAFGALEGALRSITVFSLVVALVGAAYLVVGESLKAYYVRRRDRWAFHLGGVWMLALAALLPNVGVLREWGYATFGVVYALYAGGAYLALAD
ncbi:MAG: hypothetical protein ABEH77_02335 [Halobacteriaceae archaeon]